MMPWVFVLHVISMCMFAGTILMMDLRLLGVGYMQTPFSQVQRRSSRGRWSRWSSPPRPVWRWSGATR